MTDNLNIFTPGATNLTINREYDNNQNAKSTARAAIDALVSAEGTQNMKKWASLSLPAQQIDFTDSGILVSAGAGTQVI